MGHRPQGLPTFIPDHIRRLEKHLPSNACVRSSVSDFEGSRCTEEWLKCLFDNSNLGVSANFV